MKLTKVEKIYMSRIGRKMTEILSQHWVELPVLDSSGVPMSDPETGSPIKRLQVSPTSPLRAMADRIREKAIEDPLRLQNRPLEGTIARNGGEISNFQPITPLQD